jgi:peptide/nickel transport system substrate-binding protein
MLSKSSVIRPLLACLLLALLLLSVAMPIADFASAQVIKGSASDTVIVQAIPQDQAAPALSSGKIDAYIFGLRPAQARALAGVPGIKVLRAPSALVDLVFNPAPVHIERLPGDQTARSKADIAAQFNVPTAAITNVYFDKDAGQTVVEFGAFPGVGVNPFAFKEVRLAMNYLVDRDAAVNTIYGGAASAMYTFLSSYDPDFPLVADIVLKYKFAFNPQQAQQIVSSALSSVGAQLTAGRWTYEGKPISVKFIIRTEDERRDIGDQFATQLENIGIAVERLYMTFGPAIDTVYGTDPAEFQWNIYTEGWGKTGITKFDTTSVAQFSAPWYGYMPGWAETTFWNYRNSTLDEITQKIYSGNFTSKAERDQLYRVATEMSIQEGMRAWVATQLTSYPISVNVKGFTNDVGAGLRGIWNIREMNVPGKSTLNIGHLHVYTARTVWNPVGGFTDVYSVDIMYATWDPWTWFNPFNGEPIAFRAPYAVETAGPDGKLSVPADAFIWDASAGAWKLVGPGASATSKVTFDLSNYIGTKWHHGMSFSWADVLARLAQMFDITYNSTKANVEPAVVSNLKPTLDTIVGFRINEAANQLEVYLNYWHFDPGFIASFATFNIYVPYELTLASDYLVFTKNAYRYTSSAARAANKPQLNFVLTGHASDMASTLQAFASANYFPANVFTVGGKMYATPDNAKARYQAATSWIGQHNHAWISNGPMYLDTFSPEADTATLKAFRDPSYPFSPGKWVFGEPPTVAIQDVGVGQIIRGQDGNILVDLQGPPPLFVKFILRDAVTGKILTVGTGSPATGSRFVLTLPSSLTSQLGSAFPYELTIIAYSDAVAFVAARTQFINVFDPGTITGPLEQEIEALQRALSGINATSTAGLQAVATAVASVGQAIRSLSDKTDTLGGNINSLTAQLTQSTGSLGGAISTAYALIAVVIVIQLVTLALVLRRRPQA